MFIFEQGRGRQREGDTDSETGSRLWAVNTEADGGLEPLNQEIMTWAEVGHLTNRATQAPLLVLFLFEIWYLSPTTLKIQSTLNEFIQSLLYHSKHFKGNCSGYIIKIKEQTLQKTDWGWIMNAGSIGNSVWSFQLLIVWIFILCKKKSTKIKINKQNYSFLPHTALEMKIIPVVVVTHLSKETQVTFPQGDLESLDV